MKIHRFCIERCQQCGYWNSFVKCCDYLKIEHVPRPCKAKEPDDPNCTVWTDQKFTKTPRGRVKDDEIVMVKDVIEEMASPGLTDDPSLDEVDTNFFDVDDFSDASKDTENAKRCFTEIFDYEGTFGENDDIL